MQVDAWRQYSVLPPGIIHLHAKLLQRWGKYKSRSWPSGLKLFQASCDALALECKTGQRIPIQLRRAGLLPSRGHDARTSTRRWLPKPGATEAALHHVSSARLICACPSKEWANSPSSRWTHGQTSMQVLTGPFSRSHAEAASGKACPGRISESRF